MNLNPIHRILLNTDGSITGIIEAITGRKVEVETVEQRIIRADEEIARMLKIERGDEVNYRVVYLKVCGLIYVKAISFTPLKRLQDSFRDDLMRADIPIGKIMRKHSIEARREINWKKVIKADKKLAEELKMEKSEVLVRNYNIIHKGEVLINITEFFPAERFSERF
jgi:chorismate-pyruvate lyase